MSLDKNRNYVNARLQSVLERVSADRMVPGVIAMVDAPQAGINFQSVAGFGDMEDISPLSTDDTFRIASITKLHIAASILRLVEERVLDLQEPISKRISNITRDQLDSTGYEIEKITISQLLSHTSGLRDHAGSDVYLEAVISAPKKTWSRPSQVALAMSLGAPLAMPGKLFHYSDTGYVVLGEIIERATGDSLAAATRRLLDFVSLGLQSTYWEQVEDAPEAASHRTRQYIGEIDATGFDPSLDLYGGGGLVSTNKDLCMFVRALFQGRVFHDPKTLAAGFMVPRTERPPGSHVHSRLAMVIPMGASFGWGHLGFWGCGVAWSPEHDLVVSVTINQSSPDEEGLLLNFIEELSAVALEVLS